MKERSFSMFFGVCFILLCCAVLNAQYSVGEKIEAEDLEISGVEYDCLLVGHGEGMPIEGYPDGYPSDFLYAISGNQHWLCGEYATERMPPRCYTDYTTGDDHCCDKYVSIPIDIPETGEYVIYTYVMNYPDSACLTDNRKGCYSKSKWECSAWYVVWDDVGLLDKMLMSNGEMAVAGDYYRDYMYSSYPYEVYCLKFGLDSVTVGKTRTDCKLSNPVGCDFPPTKFNLTKGNHTLYLKVAQEYTCLDWLMVSKVGDPQPAAEPGRPYEGSDVQKRDFSRPESFVLQQNFPNPFNAETTINYYLSRTSIVKLIVYNIAGQEISTLVNSRQPRGYHSVSFDAGKLPSGTYLYKLEAYCTTCGGESRRLFRQEKEMVLIR